jgi:hypothetical protein
MVGAVYLVFSLVFLLGAVATYLLGQAMLDSMVALIGSIVLLGGP